MSATRAITPSNVTGVTSACRTDCFCSPPPRTTSGSDTRPARHVRTPAARRKRTRRTSARANSANKPGRLAATTNGFPTFLGPSEPTTGLPLPDGSYDDAPGERDPTGRVHDDRLRVYPRKIS